MNEKLTHADMFAMVIGALGHDCDHRGFNNAHEMITRSELAILYNDKSVLENHHCSVTFQVAFKGADKPQTSANIFENLEHSVFNWVRQQIVAGILGTDMKFHGEHVKLMQNVKLENCIDPNQSQFIVECVIHVADIGNPMMAPEISRRWGAALAEEFSIQAEAEESLACLLRL